MQGYMRRVREWSGLVLSGKDGSGGGSEHMNGKVVLKEQYFTLPHQSDQSPIRVQSESNQNLIRV